MSNEQIYKAILSFWKRYDSDCERTVSFDACDREAVSRELAEHILGDQPEPHKANFTAPAGSASGIVASECRSIEPWIVNAARELAMDSEHVPLIARIINRHDPKPRD